MKSDLLSIIFTICAAMLHAQNNQSESKPQYAGGESDLMKYIQTHMRYPKDARDIQIQGLVELTFTVGEDGQLSNVEVKRKVWPSIDREAMRILDLTQGKWKAGSRNGKPASMRYTLPIEVRLQGFILMPVKNPHITDPRERKALNAYIRRDYAGAASLLREVCKAEPDNNFAAHDLGSALYESGKENEACETWLALKQKDWHTADLLIDQYCMGKK